MDVIDSSVCIQAGNNNFTSQNYFSGASPNIAMKDGNPIWFYSADNNNIATILNAGTTASANKASIKISASDGACVNGSACTPNVDLAVNATTGGYGRFAVIGSSADASSAYSGFKATSPISASTLWSLPTADGIVSGSPMTTDAAGHLSLRNGPTVPYLNVGASGLTGAPYINFSNAGVGTAMQISHDGSVNGAMLLRAQSGVYHVNPTNNSPVVVGAKRLFVGSSYYTASTQLVGSGGSDNESVIEGPVWIGTHTVVGIPKLAVVGDISTPYTVIFGTSPTTSTTTFHVGISTSGALGLQILTAASIKATKPNRVGEYFYCSDCSTVSTCVSTGTAVNQWALITSKTSACN
jgi:hypothetical protein